MAESMEISAPVPPASPKQVEIIRNPLLLEKIAKHLPVETLFQLRGTCTNWNKTILPVLKKKNGRSPFNVISETLSAPQVLANFMEAMEVSKDIPFSAYKIDLMFFRPNDQQAYVDFFTKYGRSITSLDFRSGNIASAGWYVDRILYDLAPGITDLTLRSYQFDEEQNLDRQPPARLLNLKRLHFYSELSNSNDLRELLEQATELESLQLSQGEDTLLSALRVLQDLNCLHKLKALTEVRLEPEQESIQSVWTLIDLSGPSNRYGLRPVRLERLEIWVTLEPSEEEQRNSAVLQLFNVLLLAQATCLRELDISFSSIVQIGQAVEIPRMENLTSFTLHQREGWRLQLLENQGQEQQNLGATFPALNRLEYSNSGRSSMKQLSQLGHDGVTHLLWNSALNLIPLRVWFPGVTRLELLIRSEGDVDELAMIWNNWPGLQFLHIKYEPSYSRVQFDLDQLLSGVRAGEFEGLRQTFAEMKTKPGGITMDILRELQDRHKIRFGIGDQKHLQKFTLETFYCSSLAFTDIGGYLGLALAPQALKIEIKTMFGLGARVEESWISEKCLAFVREALGQFAVVSVGASHESESEFRGAGTPTTSSGSSSSTSPIPPDSDSDW